MDGGHRSRSFFRKVVHINGTSLRYGGRGRPLPNDSPEALPGLGRGGPWASRQDAHQKREYVKSWTGGSRTRPYAPHPPRFARHLPLKEKAFGRLIAVLSFRRGRTPAGPQMYAARPGGRALRPSTSCHLLGKARRGCGTAPTTILEQPGPSGPDWTAESHSNFACRKYCKT